MERRRNGCKLALPSLGGDGFFILGIGFYCRCITKKTLILWISRIFEDPAELSKA